MFNTILTIQYISVVLLLFESIYIFYKWSTKNHMYLFVFCFTAMINNVAYSGEMLAKSMEESLIAVKMCYVGKVWIPLAFFMLVMEICEFHVPRKLVALMYSINFFVFMMVFFCDKITWYYTADREWEFNGLFYRIKFGHTPLYWGYFGLIILYILIGLVVLLVKIKRTKYAYERTIFMFMLAAVVAMGVSYVLYMTKATGGFDCTCIGYAIASVILFFAMVKYKIMDKLSLVRDYAIDIIPEAVLAINYDEKIIFGNDSFNEIVASTQLASEDLVRRIVESAAASDVLKLGDRIWKPMFSPLVQQGMEVGSLYVISDVTASYRHMEELVEQKDIAEAANASKSAFLSVVSHEIRTPMNAIVGMTELLLKDKEELSTKQEKYLNNIKNSGSALVMIVNDILDQSKIEAGKMEIIEASYELRPMLDDVKMIIENRIGSKPIELKLEIDEAVPKFLLGDSLRIRQILINIMNNAVKFTEEGYIRLGIDCLEKNNEKCNLRISIKDSGQGIRAEDLEKLGQAFVQVNTKNNHNIEGTGLGLSISRDFISLMGGQLEVASTWGEGTEFYFCIEQGIEEGISSDGASVSKQAWETSEKFTAPGVKALVIDDTDINLMVAREFLKTLDMLVTTAKSGEEAIALTKDNMYDIIFVDYMMPYMDGVETTLHIRELDSYKDIPIIALSGDDSEAALNRFSEAGINDFTVKPIVMNRIKSMLLKWLPADKIKSDK